MRLLNNADAPDPLKDLEDLDLPDDPWELEAYMDHLDKFGVPPSRKMIAPAERQENIRQYRAINGSNARTEGQEPPASGAEPPSVDSETPSLKQFLTTAGPRNPHKTTRNLAQYWNEHYGQVDPKTLPSLETFLPAAKEKNPTKSESALESYWQDHYGSLGAPENNPPDKPFWDDAKEVGRQVVAGAVTDVPKMTGQAMAARTRR